MNADGKKKDEESKSIVNANGQILSKNLYTCSAIAKF